MRAINRPFAVIVVASLVATAAWAATVPNAVSSDGDRNTAGGSGSLGLIDSGAGTSLDNTGFGFAAGSGLNGGDRNTLYGSYAMPSGVSATTTDNTAVGYKALEDNTGSNNTAIGSTALANNTSGTSNVATGMSAMLDNTTGSSNTANGFAALATNTIGENNTGIGFQALLNNLDGNSNSAVGASALYFNSSGLFNAALGTEALYKNSTGNNNTANGDAALRANTTGSGNTGVGRQALYKKGAGGNNTAVGFQSLLNLTSGSGNTAVGALAGNSLTTGSNNAYFANSGSASETGSLRLGGVQTKAFIAGVAGVSVANSASVLINTSTGQLGTIVSSARYKDDIQDMSDQTARLAHLRPVTFRYKTDPSASRQYGLVAEEVADVYPELVARNAKGQVETVQYHELITILLKQNQEQETKIARLQEQLDRLQAGQLASR